MIPVQSDFELPHIPHMTTITTSIRPTVNLVQWRQKHPHRYPIRLSDYYLSTRTSSNEPSCIRSRKAWVIDHTMYVSTRENGTCAFRSPSPKELHEMQWQIGTNRAGKFVKEEKIVPAASSCPGADAINYNVNIGPDGVQANNSMVIKKSISILRALKGRRDTLQTRDPETRHPESNRRSRFASIIGLNTVLSSRESIDTNPIPLPDGCITPHAIFARKFSLIADNQPLPPSLSHEMMPTADIKARNLLADAAIQGSMGAS